MAIEASKIFDWLPNVEGALVTRGYIPCYRLDGNGKRTGRTVNYRGPESGTPASVEAMGASGVTIGVGVDLGQQNEDDLRRWGCPTELVMRLLPYIGRKRRAAACALYTAPLELSRAETEALTRAEQRGYLEDVVLPWWRRFAPGRPFGELPWQAQTVVYSLVYQCGVQGALRRGPVTLGRIRDGRYMAAARALQDRSGWPDYQSRRAAEGRLLATVGAEA